MSESRIRQSQIISPQQFNVEARTSHIHRNLRYIAGLCGDKLRESLEKLDRSETLALAESRDVWWDELVEQQPSWCEPASMESSDPLFILFTSGSTAKPKGIVHGTGGYLLYATMTAKYVFDLREDDVYWCTADVGWITGHSYIVYGPLSCGATSLMFEGVPSFPNPDRYWKVVHKFGVNVLYTAPTAIRAMMREGERWVDPRDISSLRLLGSVGEPIDPKTWRWYYSTVGQGRCPIADTWWQTETGGVMITSIPGAVDMKPGSAALPFFGVEPRVVRKDGTDAAPNEQGYLTVSRPWPGMTLGIWGREDGLKDVYFSTIEGMYLTGDGAYRDEDGYFWITGRIDDVINVSGHRIGTAEIEGAMGACDQVAEVAVVGYPHPVKGEGIYAFVVVKEGAVISDELQARLVAHVRSVIGPIAKPDVVQFARALPKTRSGKVMRRILRKVAAQQTEDLSDISTLSEPSVVHELVQGAEALSA